MNDRKAQDSLGAGIIRETDAADFDDIFDIINDAARAYKGIIPDDRWHEPYMPVDELRGQMAEGVKFYGYYVEGRLLGVMGIQPVDGKVDLIRHAYVRTVCRKMGIGGKLLKYLHERAERPMLMGTWADASWAISFYRKHGFELISDAEQKSSLLRKYWNIPERQVETSVVLADQNALKNINQLQS